MLEARGLRKTYRSGNVDLHVLQGIDLRVAPGDFLAITGPSGAGKSTLLHLLAGLDHPTAGEVLWEGRPLSRMSDAERAAFRNQAVGIVFQFYHLLPELTTLENVMLPGVVRRAEKRAVLRERALACLTQVGLRERSHHKPNQLSGGELQRAAIARALVNEPRVLLCDEPTGNLDAESGQRVVQLIDSLRREFETTVVVVTHNPELFPHADKVARIVDGRMV